MSDEEEVIEDEEDQVDDEAKEAEDDGAVKDDDEEPVEPTGIEALARKQGWKPESEWQGSPPPRGFATAEEYLSSTLDRQGKSVKNLKRELDDSKKAIGRIDELEQKAHERAVRELEQRQEQAVEDGDTDAFKAAQSERRSLEDDRAKEEPKEGGQHPEFADWHADNDWFGEDITRTAHAQSIWRQAAEQTGLDGAALFDAVKDEVYRMYPEEKKTPASRRPAPVEGGGRRPRQRKQSYNDLPAVDKQLCDQYVNMTPGKTKEDFLKLYEWAEG